ncbi:electron transfer flavoprotein subunit alpha/FixB family protein [Alkaliphilus serpentinus]|uniref:Electron transfer flavoprotein subunit alpha/FixB family protein n=1 Tax=Alkaliphilus serpentinus TaxID=1482731 RepID=A0A833HNR4_9FIRM|nr:electron transfer flavoprotein subunit alpha/FixB family protein [Alkaliphilus serpentinus]KAB3529867.1 electron transfer flavoprotein subunit alpha/FixB family protein [Alkaliphilus serpentinus]
MAISEYKGVWVFAEQRGGEILNVSLELLGKGRELADSLGTKLTAVLLGDQVKDIASELIHYGADEVIVVEDKLLKVYMTETYTKVMTKVINERKPDIILMGATAIGRDLAPRVSARIHTGLTADCTSLEIEEDTKNLLMTRPAFGGNIMATIICPDHKPQMSTVRPGVMVKMERDECRSGEIIELSSELTEKDVNVEIIEIVKEEKAKMKIEEAEVLVSGGRGLGKKENFATLELLAKELGGLVSGSRAVVDAGWIDRDYQVGQTGKTVRPNLYIACGISGAIQHVTGMEDSDLIIAINKNSTAPIFEVADVGIVGDVEKVIPAVIEELKALKEAK